MVLFQCFFVLHLAIWRFNWAQNLCCRKPASYGDKHYLFTRRISRCRFLNDTWLSIILIVSNPVWYVGYPVSSRVGYSFGSSARPMSTVGTPARNMKPAWSLPDAVCVRGRREALVYRY